MLGVYFLGVLIYDVMIINNNNNSKKKYFLLIEMVEYLIRNCKVIGWIF